MEQKEKIQDIKQEAQPVCMTFAQIREFVCTHDNIIAVVDLKTEEDSRGEIDV